MSYDIVIALYNESLDWLNYLTPEQQNNVKLYNKGPSDIGIKLPNVGREGHTYLTHIIENYDTLPEYCIFLQADPFDHLKKLKPEDMPHLINDWLSYVKWAGITPPATLQFTKNYNASYDARVPYYKGNQFPATMCLGDWINEFIDDGIGGVPVKVHPCGMFAVSRDLIRTRPIEYYKRILNEVSVHNAPEAGHYLERSWHYIFNAHKHISLITKLIGSLCIILLLILICIFFY